MILAAAILGAALAVTGNDEGLDRGEYDGREISVEGVVRDAFRDEIDPWYCFLILANGRQTFYIAYLLDEAEKNVPEPFLGAKVSATGICIRNPKGDRLHIGRVIELKSCAGIRVLESPAGSPFSVPELAELQNLRSDQINASGPHRATGRVLAVWDSGSSLLLRRADGETSRVRLQSLPSPAVGDIVEASGLPETDFYRLNLSHALWRRARAELPPEPPATNCSAAAILTDVTGRTRIHTDFHGRAVTIGGTLRSLPPEGSDSPRFFIEDGEYLVPVDTGLHRGLLEPLAVGMETEVTGICIMDTGDRKSAAVFPRIDGFQLVIVSPDAIRVLSRPSWWTAGRLWSLVAALGAILLALVFRNRFEKTKARLRIEERTRLAAELHDSIAQNLTGVSMELEAGDYALAASTLNSCRRELRNCLWDLRSEALEETDLAKAILKTLQPLVDTSVVRLRFPVPRRGCSDQATHAILRIVRELAVNSIRHGRASVVRIAGALDGEFIRFSVSDNGRGFDPENAPGVLQGHFGLQGIRERAEQLGGGMTIRSSDRGTRTRVWIRSERS